MSPGTVPPSGYPSTRRDCAVSSQPDDIPQNVFNILNSTLGEAFSDVNCFTLRPWPFEKMQTGQWLARLSFLKIWYLNYSIFFLYQIKEQNMHYIIFSYYSYLLKILQETKLASQEVSLARLTRFHNFLYFLK